VERLNGVRKMYIGLRGRPIHMGGVWFVFMGGGAKQRMITYRLCRCYDWTQKPGYSNIETFPCMVGGGLAPLAPNEIFMGKLSPPPIHLKR